MLRNVALTLLLIVIAICAYFISLPKPAPVPVSGPIRSELTKVRIAFWYLPGFYLVHLADALGYFKDEGLELETHDLLPGTLPYQRKFAAGDLDAITVSNSMFYSLDLVRHGQFGLVTYDPTDASVVMATGTINSPRDLRGKRLGVNSGNEFFLYWMLDKNGIKKTDVSIATEDFGPLTDKFKKGKYDAIFVVAPISTELIKEGSGHVIYRAGDDLGLITAGVVFHDDFIAKNPDSVRRFVRAYFRAYHFSEDHHEQAIKMAADWLKLPEADTASIIDSQYFFPNEDQNHLILHPGVGIKNLHANLNYMHLFLGGSTTTENITERVTDKFLP